MCANRRLPRASLDTVVSVSQKMVRLSANLSWLFKEVPFPQRFARAAACSFRGVEILFDQYEHTPEECAALCASSGVQPVLLNCPSGDWAAGERGFGGLPGREQQFQDSFRTGLAYAEAMGCTRVHCMAGMATAGGSEATFAERLRWASEAAAEVGVQVCIEPLNAVDVPGYLLPDTAAALRVLDAAGHPNAYLQLDLYHLAVTEGGEGGAASLSRRVSELLPRTAHVQLANPPGRNEPGVGAVDFAPLLAQLDEEGYDGWVGCEYVPSTPTTEGSLRWARDFGIVV